MIELGVGDPDLHGSGGSRVYESVVMDVKLLDEGAGEKSSNSVAEDSATKEGSSGTT